LKKMLYFLVAVAIGGALVFWYQPIVSSWLRLKRLGVL